ncbi:MAG: carboxymuconolactone decarboxylase family protein [Acidobacteriaceae bacterium]
MEYHKVAPAAMRGMVALQKAVNEAGLDPILQELIKIRVSQINGCAYCIDMHTKDARALGETEQRIYALNAWRETPFFTDQERAALLWAESVTQVSEGHVPDAVYQQARTQFNEAELVHLTLAVVTINSWNRIAIAFRSLPGSYQPAKHA